MEADTSSISLVTGANGYYASHLIKKLLERNCKVRGTVRSLANKEKYQFLYDLVPEKKHNLEIVEAILEEKECWTNAARGCKYVFHIASPEPMILPEDEMEIIRPAVEGTRYVIEGALAAGVKRVVFTSSGAAIFPGNEHKEVTEEDWSDERLIGFGAKAKLLSEKVAWELYEKHKDKIEITAVCTVFTFGTFLTKRGHYAEEFIGAILTGTHPGIMDVKLPIVDVKDVAECLYQAMFKDTAAGKRYLCAARIMTLDEMFSVLKKEFEKYGYSVTEKHITPEEFYASGSDMGKFEVNLVGQDLKFNNKKIREELGIEFCSMEQSIIDNGYSVIKNGCIPDKINK